MFLFVNGSSGKEVSDYPQNYYWCYHPSDATLKREIFLSTRSSHILHTDNLSLQSTTCVSIYQTSILRVQSDETAYYRRGLRCNQGSICYAARLLVCHRHTVLTVYAAIDPSAMPVAEMG